MQVEASNNVLNTSWVKPAADAAEHKTPASEAVITELGRTFAQALEEALKSHEADPQLVQQAQSDMSKGALETPQAFDKAAENILLFGI
ncbi:MAG: hypothetical protein LLF76_15045 [Planctomycetaceae bacterium]|nr:hypothetical protein [Planctomycetaceae bacterium]